MKYLIFLLNMAFLVTAASGVAAQQNNGDLRHCGAVVEGLRVCTESLNIKINSPQMVFLQLWLENTTGNEIKIQRGNYFKYLYEVKILDKDGQKLHSFYEIAEEKQKKGTLSKEESEKLLHLCCFGSLPSEQIIAPKEIKLLNINLSDIYEFKAETNYSVEIKRIEWKGNERKQIYIPSPLLKIKITE